MLYRVVKVLFQASQLALIDPVEIFKVLSSGDEMLLKKVVVFHQNLVCRQWTTMAVPVTGAGLRITVTVFSRISLGARALTAALRTWALILRTRSLSLIIPRS